MNASSERAALPGALFRLVGYGLLTLALTNLLDILFPLQLMNPAWEFQTFGALIESSPIPLMGFAFIFYGKLENRQKWEPLILNWLSWLTLLLAICSLLLIPLGLSSAVWTNRQNHYRLTMQSDQQIAQLQELQSQLDQASSDQLETLLRQVPPEQASDIRTPQELKEQLRNDLTQAEVNTRRQAEAEQSNRKSALLKSIAKWSFGALVSGFLFFQIWRSTRWARGGSRRKPKR